MLRQYPVLGSEDYNNHSKCVSAKLKNFQIPSKQNSETTLADNRAPPKTLLFPSRTKERDKCNKQLMIEIRTGRQHSPIAFMSKTDYTWE